ncbi:MAG: translocation/assembly module TamB domain-containing protein [Verrucomicrobia bacterium]|nr:translocation/assembly module TamB domain-containing protein [Verrucomicrobiota bacterium]
MASGKRRKLLIALGILIMGMLLLIFAAPIWVPWLLRPVLARFDVQFKSYERDGYERLNLTEVSYASTNFAFSADKVAFHQPGVWLLRHWTGQFTAEDLRVEDWKLTIVPEPRNEEDEPTTLYEGLQKLDETLARIEPWLATAYLKNGEVLFEDQQILIPQLVWNHGTATASLTSTNFDATGVVSAQLDPQIKLFDINVSQPLELKANLQIQRNGNEVKLSGEIFWQTNSAHLAATFGRDDLLPATASVRSEHFRLPADLLRVDGYDDLTGSLSANWQTNTFMLEVDALASPTSGTNLPPIEVSVHATGTTNFVQIEQADLSTPWLTAKLSTNVVFNFAGELLSPEAALHVAVDLDKQDFVEATGRFVGNAFLQRSDKKYPHATFTLNSEGFAGYGVRLDGVQISGELDWPWVTLESAHIVFADGGVAHLTSRYNAVGRFFDSGTIKLHGQVGHEFLPPELSYTNIALTGAFSGSLEQLIHSGKLEVSGLRHENIGPVRIATEWQGRVLEFDTFSAQAEARDAVLQLAGSGAVSTHSFNLVLTNALLQHSGETFLALQRPGNVFAEKNATWELNFDELAFAADDRTLSLRGDIQWPTQGSLDIAAQNINSAWLEKFLKEDFPEVHLNNLQLQGTWTNGPVQFLARTSARVAVDKTNSFVVRFDAATDPQGVVIEHMDILSDSGPVLSGQGRLPLEIVPTNTNQIVQLSRTAPIDFRAGTVPNAAVWDQIAALTKFRLLDPHLHLVISGTLQNPQGTMQLQAGQVNWLGTNAQRIPPIENVRASINFSEDRIRLEELNFSIERQPVSAQAELPIGDDFSQPWRTFFDWRKASGRVQVRNAEFAAFIKYYPEILAPQGVLNADVSFAPGPQLSGSLTVNNAATRPLPNSGPLQDVYARLRFVKQQIEFEEVHALLGGQPIGFFGRIDFATNTAANLPLIDVHLRGENVPMARRTDLVLRSDLNLRLSNLTNAVPLISGNVRLRDSFYLGDLRQLIPGRVASPRRRPPFFNIETEPFSDWLMDVRVTGENFLRARSPIFRGSVSANLRVSGPLREPIALGDVRVESGMILFPFANFQVEQGFVTLTSENPYQPQLFVTAGSRAFGHDIEMTLTGPADNPVIEFSSTPPLSSEQIILMVTAGEVPRQGFGFTTEQRAQRLALFVGRSVLSRLTDGAGGERLSITTGAEISEQGRETYALEYRINEDWSIVGEYDRFGALNVGMKWRIYSR